MTKFLRYLELHLTVVGVGVVLLTTAFVSAGSQESWQLVALVATAVGIIHGCLFFAVRQRQRLVRAETIEAVKGMLRDVVNNQLQIIQMAEEMNRRRPGSVRPETIGHSISQISTALGSLSQESLSRWTHKYESSTFPVARPVQPPQEPISDVHEIASADRESAPPTRRSSARY